MAPREASLHWSGIARQWHQVGPPLRPSDQDIGFYSHAIAERKSGHALPRALILGVTPELHGLPAFAQQRPVAVDHTQAMIDNVWPGPRGTAICGEWTALPDAVGVRDIVLCDGGLHLLAYPQGQTALVANLCRVVAPGGLCIFRLFVPPLRHESTDTVLADFLAGRISDLNLLKLRLSMALQANAVEGVALKSVWRALEALAPDFEHLSAQVQWPVEHLWAINTYRDSADRYHYVTLDEARALFCGRAGCFEVQSVHLPSYELGERCPVVVFRRTESHLSAPI